jgi:hypothetical protein
VQGSLDQINIIDSQLKRPVVFWHAYTLVSV